MSFFDEVETTVANTRLLQAAEDNAPVRLDVRPFEQLGALEQTLKDQLTVHSLLRHKTVGNYLLKQWLRESVETGAQHDDGLPTDRVVTLLDAIAAFRDGALYERGALAKEALTKLDLVERPQPGKEKAMAEQTPPAAVAEADTNIVTHEDPSDVQPAVDVQTDKDKEEAVADVQADKEEEVTVDDKVDKEVAAGVKAEPEGSCEGDADEGDAGDANDAGDAGETGNAGDASDKQAQTEVKDLDKGCVGTDMDEGAGGRVDTHEHELADKDAAKLDNEGVSETNDKTEQLLEEDPKQNAEKPQDETPEQEGAVPIVGARKILRESQVNTPEGETVVDKTLRPKKTATVVAPCDEVKTRPRMTTEFARKQSQYGGLGARVLTRLLQMQDEDRHLDKLQDMATLRVPPLDMFDSVVTGIGTLLEDRLPNFYKSVQFQRLVQLQEYAQRPVGLTDFRVFRVLGRGAFGAVSAVQKLDTHAIFAMKEMDKKQIKMNQSEWMCINEKKVLSRMRSPFVLSLQYSFHTDASLFLVFGMCSGGDLKFHLNNGKEHFFRNARARFYAAEVLLGLEHIHSFNIVYRDLKPTNILLDTQGHAIISDLGLCVKLRKKPLKHLAGTAGYWAPEIVKKEGTFKTSDFWSFGVFLYQMLSGRRPRCVCAKKSKEWCPFGQSQAMEVNALAEDGELKLDLEFPPEYFVPEAVDLIKALFVVDPARRLGANGAQEIKAHPYFAALDWEALAARELTPPFVPDSHTVHANSIGEVGEFNKGKYKKMKLTEEDHGHYDDFSFVAQRALEEELLGAVIKQDNPPDPSDALHQYPDNVCCVML